MKNLCFTLILLSLAFNCPVRAQKMSHADKKAAEAKAFQETQELIAGKSFQVEINRVYPQDGFDVSRFNPSGKITVQDSTAQGRLPFFGRAYSLPHGEGGGIEFDNTMQKVTIKTIEKRKKKTVIFSFSIRGENDTFQISIEASAGENCSINVTSNNRAQISYSGKISPYTKSE